MGGYRFFILNQTAQPGIGTLLDGFRSGHYVNIVLTMFLRDLFTTLWSLLLVVPGIVKHYEYLMVPYIIAENPAMDYKEAFQISKQMMDGEKMEAFIMDPVSYTHLESSKMLLGAVLAGMMSIDFGGPFNKAAYVFGTASIASGQFDIMASVMIGGMVPPIAIALATTFFKNRFTKSEQQTSITNYIMGLSFITEGAIPFAASDPLRIIPPCIVGSAIAVSYTHLDVYKRQLLQRERPARSPAI